MFARRLLLFVLGALFFLSSNAKQYLLVVAKDTPTNSSILNWAEYMLAPSAYYTRTEDFQTFLTSDSAAYKDKLHFKHLPFQGELIKLCRLDTLRQRYETDGRKWKDIEFPEVIENIWGEDFTYQPKPPYNRFKCAFRGKRCWVFWDRYDLSRSHLTPGYHGEYYFERSLSEARWMAIIRIDSKRYALLLLSRDLLADPR